MGAAARGDGTWRLRFNGIDETATDRVPADASEPADLDTAPLLPVEFRSLVDVGHRGGELKQVAMAFIRLDGTDALLAAGGPTRVHAAEGDHRSRRRDRRRHGRLLAGDPGRGQLGAMDA